MDGGFSGAVDRSVRPTSVVRWGFFDFEASFAERDDFLCFTLDAFTLVGITTNAFKHFELRNKGETREICYWHRSESVKWV